MTQNSPSGLDKLTLNELPLVSSDSHVDEPEMLYVENFPEALRDEAPIRILQDRTVVNIKNQDTITDRVPPLKESEGRTAKRDLSGRLEDITDDSISGEVVFPSRALFVWEVEHRLGIHCTRIYNDWLVKNFRQDPAEAYRFALPAMIPTWDINEAIDEVKRAKEMNMSSAMIPLTAEPHYNMPHWDPFWEACLEAEFPVTFHIGAGHETLHYRGPGAMAVNYTRSQSMAAMTASLLSSSGVLERFPELHFVFVECGGSWLAFIMQALDEISCVYGSWQKPKLAQPPSYYLRRQIHCTFQKDEVAIRNIGFTGHKPLLWGSDYPHPEGTWPHSRAETNALMKDVPIDIAAEILGRQGAEIFGLTEAYDRGLKAALARTG